MGALIPLPLPLHIVPVGDLIVHERSADCVCGPTKTMLHRANGTDAVAYSHVSLDGREFRVAGH